MAEMKALKVDTGARRIPVIDCDGEEVGEFKFNPADWDIGKRYDQCIKELDKLELSDDITLDEFYEVSDKIKQIFNFLLGYPAEGIFAKTNPLTFTTNGDTYCEVVLEAIGKLIEEETEYRVAKKKAKIKKGIQKYS